MAVEAFKCNASDPETVISQVTKLKQRFKLSRMVMVGDYGCIQVGLLVAVSENWVTTMFVCPGEHVAYREPGMPHHKYPTCPRQSRSK